MLKRFALAALLALTAVPASAQPVEPTTVEYAAAMQNLVGRELEGGIVIAAIAAERETLVIVLDGPAGWRDGFSSEETTGLFMNGFCEDRSFDFFAGGKTLRIDTLEAGGALRPGPLVERCG